jgi:hypothetical protein
MIGLYQASYPQKHRAVSARVRTAASSSSTGTYSSGRWATLTSTRPKRTVGVWTTSWSTPVGGPHWSTPGSTGRPTSPPPGHDPATRDRPERPRPPPAASRWQPPIAATRVKAESGATPGPCATMASQSPLDWSPWTSLRTGLDTPFGLSFGRLTTRLRVGPAAKPVETSPEGCLVLSIAHSPPGESAN